MSDTKKDTKAPAAPVGIFGTKFELTLFISISTLTGLISTFVQNLISTYNRPYDILICMILISFIFIQIEYKLNERFESTKYPSLTKFSNTISNSITTASAITFIGVLVALFSPSNTSWQAAITFFIVVFGIIYGFVQIYSK